jgi:hypothetical protein
MFARSYQGFKLLRAPDAKKEDIKESLQFWVAFALVCLFDFYFEMFVSWIPLYTVFKLGLLWYMIFPSTKGSIVLFENFIEPKFQEKIRWLERSLFETLLLTTGKESGWFEDGTFATYTDEHLNLLQDRAKQCTEQIDLELERRRNNRALRDVLQPSPELEFFVVTPSTPADTKVYKEEKAPSPVPSPPRANIISPTSFGGAMAGYVTAPSYFPTRGVQVQVEMALPEDSQDATLRMLEMNESPPPTNNESSIYSASVTSEKSSSFSWMSPRWPNFWRASETKGDSDDSETKSFGSDGDEDYDYNRETNASTGPLTRSKARQMQAETKHLERNAKKKQ